MGSWTLKPKIRKKKKLYQLSFVFPFQVAHSCFFFRVQRLIVIALTTCTLDSSVEIQNSWKTMGEANGHGKRFYDGERPPLTDSSYTTTR